MTNQTEFRRNGGNQFILKNVAICTSQGSESKRDEQTNTSTNITRTKRIETGIISKRNVLYCNLQAKYAKRASLTSSSQAADPNQTNGPWIAKEVPSFFLFPLGPAPSSCSLLGATSFPFSLPFPQTSYPTSVGLIGR